MARTAGDLYNTPQLSANTNSSNNFGHLPIGATGAPGTWVGPAGITFTRTGTGTYTMVFPAAVDVLICPFVAKSATPTIFDIVMTALNATAGTAGFTTYSANGTATDPASGDILGFEFYNTLSAVK